MLALGRYRLLFTTVVAAVGIFAALLVLESTFGEFEETKDSTRTPGQRTSDRRECQEHLGQSGQQTEGTKQWRLNWWDIIISDTIYGSNFWTGRGFGINLAEADGFAGTGDPRDPSITQPAQCCT